MIINAVTNPTNPPSTNPLDLAVNVGVSAFTGGVVQGLANGAGANLNPNGVSIQSSGIQASQEFLSTGLSQLMNTAFSMFSSMPMIPTTPYPFEEWNFW